MSDTADHKCHCAHVVVLLHDHSKIKWDDLAHGLRDIRRINWAVGAIFLLVMGLAVKEVWAVERAQIRGDVPMGRSGERLAPDRIEEPRR